MDRTPFLPDEILLYIVQSVPPAVDIVAPENFEEYKLTVKTLTSLCLASKRLCALAQPVLYRSFVKEKTKYEEWEDEEGRSVEMTRDVEEMLNDIRGEGEEWVNTSASDSEVGYWEEDNRREQKEEELKDRLYQKLRIERERDLLRFSGKPRRPTRLQLFLRTLVQRSDLAARVECLRLAEFQEVYERKEEHRRPIEPALIELFEKASARDPNLTWQTSETHSALRPSLGDLKEDERQGQQGEGGEEDEDDYNSEHDDDHDDDSRSKFKYGSENAEVTLLLNLVPKLRNLDMATRCDSFGDYYHDFPDGRFGARTIGDTGPRGTSTGSTSQSLTNPILFCNLQSLSLRGSDYPESSWPAKLELESCIELLKLPTLTSLSIYGAKDESGSSRITRLSLDHIQHLHINDCSISSEVIGNLIESCKQLQTLDIQFESYAINEIEDEFFECLDKRADTLTRLILTMPHGKCRTSHMSLLDLSRFRKLRYLEICQHPLTPSLGLDCDNDYLTDLLPESLEELRIRRVDEKFTHHLENILDEFPFERFHNLKALEIELETPLDGKRPASEVFVLSTMLGECAKVMNNAGIHFRVSVRQEKDVQLMF